MRDTIVKIPPTIFSHDTFLLSVPSCKKFVKIIRKRENARVSEQSMARTFGKFKNKVFTTDIMRYETKIKSIKIEFDKKLRKPF